MNPSLPPILDDLAQLKAMFVPTRDDLGVDLIRAFVDGVKDCIAAEQSPDGEPWEQLSPDYEAAKAVKFPGQPIAFAEGLMADASEIEGEAEVTPDSASVTYGVSDAAKDEYEWFSEGDDDQPARPSWDFTPASLAAAESILDARFQQAHR